VVAHVAVGNDGQVTIPRLDMAIDCGTIVNPDRVRAQLEGDAIMSIDNALYGNSTVKEGGRAEQLHRLSRPAHRHHTRDPRPISSKTPIRPEGSANPVCRQPHRRSATRSTPPPAGGSGHCQSIRSS
jgi:hypothetical protein